MIVFLGQDHGTAFRRVFNRLLAVSRQFYRLFVQDIEVHALISESKFAFIACCPASLIALRNRLFQIVMAVFQAFVREFKVTVLVCVEDALTVCDRFQHNRCQSSRRHSEFRRSLALVKFKCNVCKRHIGIRVQLMKLHGAFDLLVDNRPVTRKFYMQTLCINLILTGCGILGITDLNCLGIFVLNIAVLRIFLFQSIDTPGQMIEFNVVLAVFGILHGKCFINGIRYNITGSFYECQCKFNIFTVEIILGILESFLNDQRAFLTFVRCPHNRNFLLPVESIRIDGERIGSLVSVLIQIAVARRCAFLDEDIVAPIESVHSNDALFSANGSSDESICVILLVPDQVALLNLALVQFKYNTVQSADRIDSISTALALFFI